MSFHFFSRFRMRAKAMVFLVAVLLPFCIVLVSSLTAHWMRTVSVLDHQLEDARQLVVRSIDNFHEKASLFARIIADNYSIRQAVFLNDVGAIKENTLHLFKDLDINHYTVYDAKGRQLYQKADFLLPETPRRTQAIRAAMKGDQISFFTTNQDLVLLEAFVPVYHTNLADRVVGCVCVGYRFSDDFAREIKTLSGIDVLLMKDRVIIAHSFYTPDITLVNRETRLWQHQTLVQTGGCDYDAAVIPFQGTTYDSLVLYAALDQSQLKKTLSHTVLTLFWSFFVTISISAVVAMSIAKNVTGSVNRLMEHTRLLAEGNFDTKIDLDTADEFGEVAGIFNSMASRLKESFVRIENQAEELSVTKTYLDNVIDSIPSMLIGIDGSGNVIKLNRKAAVYFGHTDPVSEGLHLLDLLRDYHSGVYTKIQGAITCQEPVHIENLSIRETHQTAYHNLGVFPIVDDQGGGTIISISDVTERYYMEIRLRQNQKMEAIGRLAGGIAHDFNNILSSILGYSQLALGNICQPEKSEKYITNVVKGAERASGLVQQILTFSRRTEYQKKPLLIHLEVKETLKLLRSTVPATIDFDVRLQSESRVLADPSKIHQVVMNLCTNAYHAMRLTGGTLSVFLEDVRIERKIIRFQNRRIPPGQYLRLIVEDTGSGMDPKILEKAFEPYYTTKEAGQGTGLGLSLVQAIVDEHDGFLDVRSEPGKGTRFLVYFPMVAESEEQQEIPVDPIVPCNGSETVMIVDDEPEIREMFAEFFSAYGYTPCVYANGREALDAYTADSDRFDLIITDMTMPEVTGFQLATEVLALTPDLPIILCTGFSDQISEADALDLGIRKYFHKPVRIDLVLASARSLLDEQIVNPTGKTASDCQSR